MTAYLLRFSFSYLFFWFGVSQLINPERWVSFIPEFAPSLTGLHPETLVLLNGWSEITLAFFLIIGLNQKIVSIILAIHVLAIATNTGGALGVRNLVLGLSCLSLAFLPSSYFSLDEYLKIDSDNKN